MEICSLNIFSKKTDAYFSADIETDGPIPGPYSILSIGIVYAGTFDGESFIRSNLNGDSFYRELKPISDNFQSEALSVNGLDREKLLVTGEDPESVMMDAFDWIENISGAANPVLVAYPLSFDWTWLYWYFIRFCKRGSPFEYSRCFDIKTAFAVKAALPISAAGRSHIPLELRSKRVHSHNALDDALEQADIFANIFEWNGIYGRNKQ